MTRRALVVVDLGFGDAGKGLVTDALVRRHGAGLVVRYNGGAQAGHNVVTPDGRHHTFAQLGAGTFVPGTRTWLAPPVVVHPTGLLAEADALARVGVADALARVAVSASCRVVTPFHQAANRLRELGRGVDRHGSCGVGIGETVDDALRHPDDAVLAGDLARPVALRARLARVRERVRAGLDDAIAAALDGPHGDVARDELALLEHAGVAEAWRIQAAALAGRVRPDEALAEAWRSERTVVLEGAQGVLLDQDHGLHPHTTWSCCTPDPARALAVAYAPDVPVTVVGVLRSHGVRHGAGPLPGEAPALSAFVREHNTAGPWQGPVRHAPFDAVLGRYALEVVGGVDVLVLTHLDAVRRRGGWPVATAWRLPDAPDAIRRLPVHRAPDLDAQARLTATARGAAPVLDEVAADDVVAAVEEALGRAVDAVVDGPTAHHLAARTAAGARALG